MAATARELETIASALAHALCEGASPAVKGLPGTVAAVALAVLQENFRMEAAIEREADKQLEALGPAARGLDTDKLRAGLRERIAKQKKFPL